MMTAVQLLLTAVFVPAHSFVVPGAARVCTRRIGCALVASGAAGPPSVKRFIEDLELLGDVRLVVVGSGAILETVGSFERLRVNDKQLATVSSSDNSFECHIKLAEVRKAAFVIKDGKEKTLHIIRLLADDESTLLSAILTDQSDDEGAVDFWMNLRERFGEVVEFAGAS